MKFNDKLLDLRKKAGLSQEELGNKLNVSRQTISKWEAGKSTPELEKLISLSQIFNISLDEFINNKENKSQTVETKKIIIFNKKILLLIGIIICIFLGYMTYRYLSIKNYTNQYFEFAEKTQNNGGKIDIYRHINNEYAYETHYFKKDIQHIKYRKIDNGQIYLYKTEYINANEKYVIDEINKTYTYSNTTKNSGSNTAFYQMCDKINSNIIFVPFVKFYNLRILFNPNYTTNIEGNPIENNTSIQRGRLFTLSTDIYISSFGNMKKDLYYIEDHFNKNDRTKKDTESYFYSDIGKSLQSYLQVPDLTNYTLIEE